MQKRFRSLLAVVLCAIATSAAAQTAKRAITLDDHSKIVGVGDPQRSPDGQWIAYTVTTIDADADKRNTDIWMVKWDGSEQLRLTSSPDGESSPRWSPDGKYLAFIASRGTEEEKKKGGQIWLLPRAGGEAQRVSDVKGGVSDIVWSPDSTRIAFVASDPDPRDEPEKMDGWKRKTTPPIVIDRYQFKQDRAGYLTRVYQHIAVFDLATKQHTVITSGQVDDSSPSWSPDGTRIAFTSKRAAAEPDRTSNDDVWVVDAKGGAEPKRLTNTPEGEGGRPAWSPDGSRLAVLVGSDDQNTAYGQNRIAIVPANAPTPGAGRIITGSLDRTVSNPSWSADGRSINFLVQDDRAQYVASIPAEGGTVRPVTSGRRVIQGLNPGVGAAAADGNFAVQAFTATELPEIWALDKGQLRKLTKHNEALQNELQFAITEDFTAKAKDGNTVNGLIVKPANYVAGRKYPTLLIIHGGPNAQDQHSFSFDREFFAANGYVVLAINYRGSAGRGNGYQKAIHGDWGNLEVVDLLAAVDEAVRQGIADPDRLGIGGWSYGGISTNYTIATDTRFKSAVSGAGSSLQSTMYGIDQYIVQYDQEVGQPWKNKEKWDKLSYPFWHADRIRTPTLFMGGEKDFNVPIQGGEQMYQALKSNGVDTQLVIYPGQFHGLTIPSYERDRVQRYLNWFNKYLQPAAAQTSAGKQ